MPLGNPAIPLVSVFRFLVSWLWFPAVFAAVQGRKDEPISDAHNGKRLPENIRENRA
jgi:hypothetical protein